MAVIKTIFKGESLSMLFTFPEAYDMSRIEKQEIYIGSQAFTGTVSDKTIALKLKSDDTGAITGQHRISLWLDDSILGVKKPYLGDIVFSNTNATPHNTSTSNISDIIIPIVISETAVTVGDILYNILKGDKGDTFLYSDFTPEQVEALKVKGDKGDSFEYEDFTPEQITVLQQPATDIASTVSQAEGLRVTAESGRVTAEGLRVTAESNRSGAELLRSGAESDRSGAELLRAGAENTREGNEDDREQAEALRVQAEIDRQTNTGTAIQNAETATQNANDAAALANSKAGLANDAATNANTKAGLADTAATNANTKAGLANTAATNANNVANGYAAELALKEVKANKQNSLTPDGTGVKFPTVDAVKSRADEIESLIIRKLVEPLGATYNTTTKLFSLNGLTDITEAQMINIYNYTAVMIKASLWSEAFNNVSFRTNIQGASKGNISVQANYSFQNNPALEVFKMSNGVYLTLSNNMFYGCGALREVDYIFMLMTTAGNVLDMFRNCGALVTCNLRNLKVNLSFAWSPLLSLASLQYLIQYRANGTTPITITVHPTVFAKLTDNTNYPTWYAVNQDALTKYITFASA